MDRFEAKKVSQHIMHKQCRVDGCDRQIHAKGICNLHRQRLSRTGTTDAPVLIDDDSRFFSKVQTTAPGCWDWIASKRGNGYGQFYVREIKREVLAHRWSYERFVGPIPAGLVIDHKCHNPSCVNPQHLHAVTIKENGENMLATSKRSASGYRGVYWDCIRKLWYGQVTHHGVRHHAGHFDSPLDAAQSVRALRNTLYWNNPDDRGDA